MCYRTDGVLSIRSLLLPCVSGVKLRLGHKHLYLMSHLAECGWKVRSWHEEIEMERNAEIVITLCTDSAQPCSSLTLKY